MATRERPRSGPSSAITSGDHLGTRLDSWKEIAGWLNRSEKTVRRWEETEGLPVHRLLHDKRSSVYAYSGELQRWLDFRRAHEGAAASAPDQWALEEGNGAVGEYPTLIKSLPDVSAAPLPAPTTPWPARRILIGFSIGLVVAGLALLLRWRPFLQPAKNQTVATLVRTVPLATLPGEIEGLALSPDGRQIAFTWNGPNVARWNLYVQRIGGESPLQITHTDGGMITGVDWSPDGRLLSFGRCREGNRGATPSPHWVARSTGLPMSHATGERRKPSGHPMASVLSFLAHVYRGSPWASPCLL
jgi:hypothetical protein